MKLGKQGASTCLGRRLAIAVAMPIGLSNQVSRVASSYACPAELPAVMQCVEHADAWQKTNGATACFRFFPNYTRRHKSTTPGQGTCTCLSASHRPGVGTDAAVSQSRQRLESAATCRRCHPRAQANSLLIRPCREQKRQQVGALQTLLRPPNPHFHSFRVVSAMRWRSDSPAPFFAGNGKR